MLTGLYVLIVGGDERQLEVIDHFIALDANVRLVGYEHERLRTLGMTKTTLTDDECARTDVLILPITGINEHGIIESSYAAEVIQLRSTHISALPHHAKVYTGMANDHLTNLCAAAQIQLIELLKRDDLAILNSIPTAEGALALAIQHTTITIHSSQIHVLGFGRVGMTLARLLRSLGAHVSVVVQHPEQYARAFEMGLNPFYMSQWQQRLHTADLLFNTIPTMIITAQIIAGLAPHTVIIDLASKPGGTDFRFAEKRRIKAMLAPSLPGLVAPKTAGTMIANTLCQLISVELGERTP